VRAEADVKPCYLAEDVPDAVAAFYRVNDVARFRFDRPFYSGDKSDGDIKVRPFISSIFTTSEQNRRSLTGILCFLCFCVVC